MLDDELFADRHREIGARRQRAERPAELLAFERHPGRHAAALSELDGLDDHLLLPALLVDAHDLADFQQVRWNRDDPAGPCDVTVQDKLARLCERTRKAEPINNVIEPPFEQHQQVLTGDSGHPLGNFEVLRKLLFEQPVNPLDLLLFTQADRELREAGARLSMRSWRIITPFDRALVSIATLALQEELQAFAPAHPADWSKISSHDIPLLAPASDPAPFWRTASVVRYRGHVLDRNYRESGGLKRADRGFAAATGALDVHDNAAHSVFRALARGSFRRHLCGKRSTFARTFEADRTGARPRYDEAQRIGNRHDRIVEGRMHMGDAFGHRATRAAFAERGR